MNIEIIGLFIIIYLALLIFFYRYIKLIPPVSIFLSSIERIAVNIGFSLSPIVFFSFLAVPIVIFRYDKLKTSIPKGLIISLIFIVFSAFLSISGGSYTNLAEKSSLYIFLYALIILIEYILMRNTPKKSILYISILITVLVFSLYGLIQYIRFKSGLYPDLFNFNLLLNNNSLNPLDFNVKGNFRPNSLFNDVNTSAGFILLYLPFIYYYTYSLFNKIKAKIEKKSLFLFIFSLITLILSTLIFIQMQSRSAFIAFGFMFLFSIFILYLKKKSFRKYIFAGVLLLIAVIGIYSLSHKYIISNKINGIYNSEFSAQAHVVYTQSALREFQKNPITGGGVGSFYTYFNDEMRKGIVGYYQSVDNPPLYIKYLAEEGIIGFISNVGFFLWIIYVGIKKLIYIDNKINPILLSLLLGFIGLLSSNLFHAYLPLYFSAIFFGLIISVLFE